MEYLPLRNPSFIFHTPALKDYHSILFETLMSTPMSIWNFNTVDGFDERFMYTVCAFSYSTDVNINSISNTQFINQILNKMYAIINKHIISIDLHGNYIFFIPFKSDTSINNQMKLIYILSDMLNDNLLHFNKNNCANISLYGGVGYSVSDFSD